jgi:hypothetical protein
MHIHANPTKNARTQAAVRLGFSKTVKLQFNKRSPQSAKMTKQLVADGNEAGGMDKPCAGLWSGIACPCVTTQMWVVICVEVRNPKAFVLKVFTFQSG